MIAHPENQKRADRLTEFVKNWTVMKDQDGNRQYFYGPLDEYGPDDLEGLSEIQRKDWTGGDYLEILANITEDRNHHWLCCLFNDGIPQAMENAGLGPAQRKAFAATIAGFIAENIYK